MVQTQINTEEIRLHNALVESIKADFCVQEQRILFYIVAKLITSNDKSLTVPYSIPVKHYADTYGITDGGKLREEISEIGKRLTKKNFCIEDNEKNMTYVSWAYKATYKAANGTLDIYMPDDIEPYLISLKEHFTSTTFENIPKFKCKYTTWMYLWIVKNRNLKKRKISIADFRDTLGIREDVYPRYYDFKKRILLRMKAELDEHAQYSFNFEEIKNGKTVTDFYITFPTRPLKIHTDNNIIDILTNSGVSNTAAKDLESKHDPEFIEWALARLKKRSKKTKIESFEKYLNRILENDHNQFVAEKEQDLKKNQTQIAIDEETQAIKDQTLKADQNLKKSAQLTETIESLLFSLPQNKKDAYINQFAQTLSGIQKQKFIDHGHRKLLGCSLKEKFIDFIQT